MTTPCYLFDIDGTLANGDHRNHLITTPDQPKDWKTYFSLCSKDEPIPHVVGLARRLANDANILFVSGRTHECFEDTHKWLRKHVGWWVEKKDIYLRAPGDHRQDNIVKIELLAKLRADGYEPIMAFDDRSRVVSAWREAGVPCAQVAPGDF